jgi:mRNA interferase RelE/StbE
VTSPARRYSLAFTPAALRSLRKLPREIAVRIKAATEALCDDPRPHGVKALSGSPGWLRVRIGDYRVIYEVRDAELVIAVIQVGHRSKIYRDT